MKRGAGLAIAAWLTLLAGSAWIVSHTQFSADLSAFLPRSPSPAQQILVDQLREGVVSRIILIGIEGAAEPELAQLSRRFAERLGDDPAFVYASNGAEDRMAADGELLIRHRYLLSPEVSAARFTTEALRKALERQIDLLASPMSMLVSQLLPRDPTGEFLAIAERLQGNSGPEKRHGVWFAGQRERALLVVQTRAAGFDIDAQEAATGTLRAEFERAKRETDAAAASLLFTGPGVFAVQTRAAIKSDAIRITSIAIISIALLLLLIYRSVRVLGLTLLPVASGALAGISAVHLAFGSVHGITLGFGATLIGEAVDYAIYLFTNTARDTPPGKALERIWPTLRLGVLTSVCGFGAMLLSGFPGLAQLGLFSLSGLIVALSVTRWVLPNLAPAGYSVLAVEWAGPWLLRAIDRAHVARIPLALIVIACAAWLVFKGGTPWSDELATLSPVPAAEQNLDAELRRELGAPDVRQLIVVRETTEQAALETAESVAAALQALVEKGGVEGFDSPARYLPSKAAQRARQSAIPDAATLTQTLSRAVAGMPFREGVFEPFIAEADAARTSPLLERADFANSALGIQIDSLLVARTGQWYAMLPLRGVADVAAIESALRNFEPHRVVLLDLKRETDALYQQYRARVMAFSLLGAAVIVVVLVVALRSVRRALAVAAPLGAALIVTCAALVAAGAQLTIFHLVALLLVVGVGSNYTLFFDRENRGGGHSGRTATSLALCNLSTVIGFGLIGFATTPVLSAIGTTVALGAALSLIFAAILSTRGAGA